VFKTKKHLPVDSIVYEVIPTFPHFLETHNNYVDVYYEESVFGWFGNRCLDQC